jgi:hypothetical protein
MGKSAVIEKKRPVTAQVAVEGPTCQHHWIIATPQGATSLGRCRVCGEQREFRNSATDHLWEDESSSGYNAWRGNRGGRAAAASSDDDSGPASAAVGGTAVLS